MWDQYLAESMKWEFGKSLKLWNHETKIFETVETDKPKSQEIKKPRSPETKDRETDGELSKNNLKTCCNIWSRRK